MRPRKYVNDEGRVRKEKVDKRTEKTLCGKARYSSRKLAKAVAKGQARETGEPIEAYHCCDCHAYHIGHPPGWSYGQHRQQYQVT